jgi:hypothetical protein
MRHATWLGSLLVFAAVSPSIGQAADADLLSVTCSAGAVTVTAKSPWQTNPKGPWAWDKGALVSKDERQVKFKGAKCEGTVKAHIANGSQAKGPIAVSVR